MSTLATLPPAELIEIYKHAGAALKRLIIIILYRMGIIL